MSFKLIIFYFVFMFVSIGLFSIENGVTGSERFSKKEKDITPAKVKKSFKHVSRYSNLC